MKRSDDGGKTWSALKIVADNKGEQAGNPAPVVDMTDSVCEGSILTIGRQKQNNILAFCNNADIAKRDNLTLHISFDNGKTRPKEYIIDKAGNADNSAYSDIVQLSKKTIGVLYEKNNYSSIVFTVVKW